MGAVARKEAVVKEDDIARARQPFLDHLRLVRVRHPALVVVRCLPDDRLRFLVDKVDRIDVSRVDEEVAGAEACVTRVIPPVLGQGRDGVDVEPVALGCRRRKAMEVEMIVRMPFSDDLLVRIDLIDVGAVRLLRPVDGRAGRKHRRVGGDKDRARDRHENGCHHGGGQGFVEYFRGPPDERSGLPARAYSPPTARRVGVGSDSHWSPSGSSCDGGGHGNLGSERKRSARLTYRPPSTS